MIAKWDDAYSVRSMVRESSHADLFRATRKEDQRAVLLKVPHGKRGRAVETARLKHEYAILRSIEAAGVIRALDLEIMGDTCFLVLDDVGEESLDTLLQKGRPELESFLKTAISIANVVEIIHRHRVIHKDIRPHHFFRKAGEEQVVLVDFGLATRLSLEDRRAVGVGHWEGTLAYMSPEQTGRMNRVLDRRTDLYSLGVTFYELLTGVLPFQTTDPLELVHSHIARTPVPPYVLSPNVPRPLSDIIMKLLSKVAEDRYQDTAGLKADLQICLASLRASGQVAGFVLGERDFSEELRIPQKLYGRETQRKQLLEAFGRARAGSPELLLISGYSGVGKSALVNELQKEMVRAGHFVAGKFDQIGRSVPYAPIAQACSELVRSILTASSEVLSSWRHRILEAVGPNGQVITDLVPELELVIGKQPLLPALEASDSQHRFELAFQSFLRVFATEEHPLAFFLDDLQWADAASLRLIHLILTGARNLHVLVIGAYRDNEVDPVHPLRQALSELRKVDATIHEVALSPLRLTDVRQLIGDTLPGCVDADADRLAALILQKTHGNPFFLTQFLTSLHKDGLLRFDPDAHTWTWNQKRIEETMVTDNVVDFMVSKLRRLAPETQLLLQLASCVGYRFEHRTLALISEQSSDVLAAGLWNAVEEGLVVPLDLGREFPLGADSHGDPNPAYRFQHDRVQQAAYALIADSKKREVHLHMGRLMMANRSALSGDDFAIVNHLNEGAALIVDAEERLALARMNLEVALRARSAAAYGVALKLLVACFELLGSQAWDGDRYELARAAQLARAECEYLNGNIDEALLLLDVLDVRARVLMDRVSGLTLRTIILTTTGRLVEAAACGLRTATFLGADFPASPGEYGPAIGVELGLLHAALGDRSVESLLDLPLMTAPESIALGDVLHRTNAAAAQTNPELMVLLILKAVNHCLRQGNSSDSSYFYTCYGLVLAVQGQFELAYRLGQIGLELSQRWKNKTIEAANHFVFACYIAFWRAPLSLSVKHQQLGQKISLESGNYIYSAYCMSFQSLYRLFGGENLDQLAVDLPGFEEFLVRTGDGVNSQTVRMVRGLVARLKGEPSEQSGSGDQAERVVLESGSHVLINVNFLLLAMGLFFEGQYAESTGALHKGSPAAPANIFGPEMSFWRVPNALVSVDLHNADQKKMVIEAARHDLEAWRVWAVSSPGTFGHRHALLVAELAALEGADGTIELYERAIAASEEAGSLLHEALGNERAGRYLLRQNRSRLARFYLSEAHRAYERWGATRKARALASELRLESVTEGAGAEVRADQIDALAVMRASQTISTEIVLSKLVQSLMAIVIEQAGAERGYLMLLDDGELWVEGVAGSAAATVTAPATLSSAASSPFARYRLSSSDHAAFSSLPFSVVSYVQRTQKTVLLAHAERANIFSSDPYLEACRPRSLLCLPMMRQGQLVGLLYLENRLTGDAFSAAQVGMLEVLSAQAAISLENAALYEDMEIRVADRTRELQASLRLIKENQAQLIEAERKTAVARYESELAIAQRIQTSILPRNLNQVGFEMAAGMVTASEVGGDYYDVVPVQGGGFWLGIGDVSGHGLNAGLMMLMIQSGLGALMRRDPFSDPATLVCLLNAMLFENVRTRLGGRDFATLSLFRFYPDGTFVFAGAHEEMLIWRAATGKIETASTDGTWVGISDNIDADTISQRNHLDDGDVLVLYTDGIIEAGAEEGRPFGLGGLAAILASMPLRPVGEICDEVFRTVDAHAPERTDDRTLLVVRRVLGSA